MDLKMQLKLFEEALQKLKPLPDLVNQVLEITMEDDQLQFRRYKLPPTED
jgi:hypothetical protein